MLCYGAKLMYVVTYLFMFFNNNMFLFNLTNIIVLYSYVKIFIQSYNVRTYIDAVSKKGNNFQTNCDKKLRI